MRLQMALHPVLLVGLLTACGPGGGGGGETSHPDASTPIAAPGAEADALVTLDEDGTSTMVLRGVSDDPSLTITITGEPEHGTVTPLTGAAPLTVTYTPTANAHGVDTLTFEVTDSANQTSRPATVVLAIAPVNDAPAAADDTGTTAATDAVVVDVLANDSDVDGDPLAVTITTPPTSGTAVVNASQAIQFTPDPTSSGAVTIGYSVRDPAGLTAEATLTVTVGDVELVRIDSFTASPEAVSTGGETTLTWSTSGASACTLTPGTEDIMPSGSLTVSPSAPTVYTLSCEGAGGPVTAQVRVFVDVDSDGDGLADLAEAVIGTDATLEDTDADGITDGVEFAGVTDPLRADTDGDLLADGIEDANANGARDPGETDPLDADSDDDGLTDGVEDADHDGSVDEGETDALDADSDDDSLADGAEDRNGDGVLDADETDPRDPDSDNDGFCDGFRADNDADEVLPADACVSQDVFFVSPRGALHGDGRSWATAYRHPALLPDTLAAGQEVWIETGTYRPIMSRPTLTAQAGVVYRGGFLGTESHPSHRPQPLPATELSGDTADNDDPADPYRSYEENLTNVVAEGGATLQGFQLTHAPDEDYGSNNEMVRGAEPAELITFEDCLFDFRLLYRSAYDGRVHGSGGGLLFRRVTILGSRDRNTDGALFRDTGSITFEDALVTNMRTNTYGDEFSHAASTHLNRVLLWGSDVAVNGPVTLVNSVLTSTDLHARGEMTVFNSFVEGGDLRTEYSPLRLVSTTLAAGGTVYPGSSSDDLALENVVAFGVSLIPYYVANANGSCTHEDLSNKGISNTRVAASPLDPGTGLARFLAADSPCRNTGVDASADNATTGFVARGLPDWRALTTLAGGTLDDGLVDPGYHHAPGAAVITSFVGDTTGVSWTIHDGADARCELYQGPLNRIRTLQAAELASGRLDEGILPGTSYQLICRGGGGPASYAVTTPIARSCADHLARAPASPNGGYTIDPDGAGEIEPFRAECDMTRDGGGWMYVPDYILINNGWFTVTGGPEARTVGTAFSLDPDPTTGTSRGAAVLPLSFTEIQGSFSARETATGDHADDDVESAGWGTTPTGEAGSILFGTPDTIIKRGGEFGADFNLNGASPVHTIPITTVPATNTIWLESQQAGTLTQERVHIHQLHLWVR